MKWTYSIKNKLLASVALLSLCLLVLLSHYLDKIHTQRVKNSITTLYEDRLIAEGYILKMTGNIYQIREVLNAEPNDISKSKAVAKPLAEFKEWYAIYMKTKLTVIENETAIALSSAIKDFEQKLINNGEDLSIYTDKALFSLNKLSNVQLDESKLIMKNAESEYAAIKISSQFAFTIILIILFVLQAIVFSSKTLITVTKPKDTALN